MADLSEHFRLLDTVAAALEAVDEKGVFVGGMISGLLITDPLASGIRPTDDVDFIVEVASYTDYQTLLRKLEKGGFSHEMKHPGPLCRMKLGSIAVDVLPTKEDVLSFSNAWYILAVETAISFKLPNERVIQIVNAPLFVCTKLDAFADRGKDNYMTSTDLEDIVAILNWRKELWQEVWRAPKEARDYLKKSFTNLLEDGSFLESLDGFLPYGDEKRKPIILRRMKAISEMLSADKLSGTIEIAYNMKPIEARLITCEYIPDDILFPTIHLDNAEQIFMLLKALKLPESPNQLPKDVSRIYKFEDIDFSIVADLRLLPPLARY